MDHSRLVVPVAKSRRSHGLVLFFPSQYLMAHSPFSSAEVKLSMAARSVMNWEMVLTEFLLIWVGWKSSSEEGDDQTQ